MVRSASRITSGPTETAFSASRLSDASRTRSSISGSAIPSSLAQPASGRSRPRTVRTRIVSPSMSHCSA